MGAEGESEQMLGGAVIEKTQTKRRVAGAVGMLLLLFVALIILLITSNRTPMGTGWQLRWTGSISPLKASETRYETTGSMRVHVIERYHVGPFELQRHRFEAAPFAE
jgi:hypothetical protein